MFSWGGLSAIQRKAKQSEGLDSARMPTKLVYNVSVERSVGPMHVMMSPENTVMELVRKTLNMYVDDGRRPLLQCTDPKGFELHYSSFNLECLDPQEKLRNLGSRNFFLCSTQTSRRHQLLLDRLCAV